MVEANSCVCKRMDGQPKEQPIYCTSGAKKKKTHIPLTSFTPKYVLTPQTLTEPPATTNAVAMQNALREYRAPSKLLSSSTLDVRNDATPEEARNRLPAFANGFVCAEASSSIREDRGVADEPASPRCGGGRCNRLLTGGAESIFDVDVNVKDGYFPPPTIEVAARCRRRRSAMGKARAVVVMASW